MEEQGPESQQRNKQDKPPRSLPCKEQGIAGAPEVGSTRSSAAPFVPRKACSCLPHMYHDGSRGVATELLQDGHCLLEQCWRHGCW
jgi:hypothetical protein